MRPTRLLCVILAGVWPAVSTGAQRAAPVLLPGPLRAHVMEERFQIVTSLRGLPLGVRDELQTLFGGPPPEMTLAGCSIDHCLVYYDRSGSMQVALFHWTPDATRLELAGIAPRGLSSIDEVRKAVLSGAIKGAAQLW